MERQAVRQNAGDFSAFSPLAGGTPDTYFYGVEYPYDLDASLDYMRPQTGVSVFPFPETIGHVLGLCPLYGDLARRLAVPGYVSTELNILDNSNLPFVFPDINGGLRKVSG